MIFVTLGTQDKSFNRLLEAIDKEIKQGNITDKVIVQAGCTKYQSPNMKIIDLMDITTFNKYLNEADLIITHGGVGTILDALKKNKKVIAIPRLSKYQEAINDHQIQICKEFSNKGYILSDDLNNLSTLLKQVNKFNPQKYISNNSNFIKIIENYIEGTDKNET